MAKFRFDTGEVVGLDNAAGVTTLQVTNHPLPNIKNSPKVSEEVAAQLGVLPVEVHLRRSERFLYVKRDDGWFHRGEVVEV